LAIVGSRLVGNMELEVGKVFSPANLATVKIFGCHEPLKATMICNDVKGVLEREKEGTPLETRVDNGEHLLVVNLVVGLCWRHCL